MALPWLATTQAHLTQGQSLEQAHSLILSLSFPICNIVDLAGL